MNEQITFFKESIARIENKESNIYFLVYDTKNNARMSIKYIYDLAYYLKEEGYKVSLLSEDKTYSGVSSWLDDKYEILPLYSIKDDKINIRVDDTVVIPEYYANNLPQFSKIKCNKIFLAQQLEYMYDTFPMGQTLTDFGIDKVIVTTEYAKKYFNEFFPLTLVFVIPPIIEDYFSKIDLPKKPFIALSIRDRVKQKKLVSEFYLKYPLLRWIPFKDMVQMSNKEFAHALKECMVSVWIDDESTFGTFPIESMKCDVPVIGKIPSRTPDWLGENGLWTYDEGKIVEVLGTFILAYLDGILMSDDVNENIKKTLLMYDNTITINNIKNVFKTFKNKRKELLEKTLEKLETTI